MAADWAVAGRRWTIAPLFLAAGCIAGTAEVEPRPDPVWPEAVAAAISAMVAHLERPPDRLKRPVHVDPHPAALPLPEEIIVWRANATAYHAGIDVEVARIGAHVRTMGLKPVRALAYRPRCDGFRVPPQQRNTEDCPAESETVLLLGLPKPGGGSLWTVEVVTTHYWSRGRGVEMFRVELEREVAGFRVLSIIELDVPEL